MSYILIALVIALFALLYKLVHKNFSYWEERGIPNETPSLIYGNLKGVGTTVHFRDITQGIYTRFKGTAPFAGAYFFFKKTVILMDLDLIKSVLIKDFSNFRDRGVFYNPHDDPLSGHLFSLDGEEWRSMRAKLAPVFTSGKMKFMYPTVLKVADNMIPLCEDTAMKAADGAIEIKELCARYTTDVIGTCAFGIECNSLHDENSELRTKGRKVITEPRHTKALMAFIQFYPKLARKLHFKIVTDEVTDFFMNVVRSTVTYRLEHNVKRNDFMNMLIEMKAKDEEAAKRGDGIDLSHGLTMEQLAAQAFLFFVAGFDTSSSTMAFALYELAFQQDVQDKLREEILSVLESHDNELTYEAIYEMHYLEQVFNETLRKYPVLPFVERVPTVNYTVPGTKHIIEADTPVLIPTYALHHDPEYFPNPEEFDPDRFAPEAVKQRHPMTHLPFGDGPRNCIGLRFGKMQGYIGLITLLKQFKFYITDRTERPLSLDKDILLTAAKNGIYLRVERI